MADFHIKDAHRLSHAYIISAASQEESQAQALRIAAAAVCTGTEPLPCGSCRACRKAFAGIHPDIIRVRRETDDKGRQKKELRVDQVRAMAADAVVLPNEAERKVYLIEDADRMNLQAQNAALKLLEEPPAGVHFLLCVTNPQQLLPTVRSRCAELVCSGGDEEADEDSRKLAAAFVRTAARGDPAELLRWCMENEGLDTRSAVSFLESTQRLLADMACGRADARGLSRSAIVRLNGLTEDCLRRLKVNTGVKHIFGLLAVEAIDSSGNRGSGID